MSDTSTPFSPAEVAEIAHAIRTMRSAVECPRCANALIVINLGSRKAPPTIEWLFSCVRCERSVLAKDLQMLSKKTP